jgi:hypothetical protein
MNPRSLPLTRQLRSCMTFGVDDMTSFTRLSAALLLASLGGCATLTDSNQQVVALQTIQDHREIDGVGCVLSNQAGRWFATSPGRVTIRKSAGDLSVDCKKEGAGSGSEVVASSFGTGNLIGNLVVSAGLGYLVDRHSGAGFDYPATLLVVMRATPAEPESTEPAGNALF